jgi:hypothetical protein
LIGPPLSLLFFVALGANGRRVLLLTRAWRSLDNVEALRPTLAEDGRREQSHGEVAERSQPRLCTRRFGIESTSRRVWGSHVRWRRDPESKAEHATVCGQRQDSKGGRKAKNRSQESGVSGQEGASYGFGPVPLPLLDNQTTLPGRYPRMEMIAPLPPGDARLTYNGRYTTKPAHSACSLQASTSNNSSIACRTAMRSGMTKTPGIGCPATTRA